MQITYQLPVLVFHSQLFLLDCSFKYSIQLYKLNYYQKLFLVSIVTVDVLNFAINAARVAENKQIQLLDNCNKLFFVIQIS